MCRKRTASWHLFLVSFFSSFSLSATELLAESTLTGQVLDKQNNPLAYVPVILEPTSRGDVTDESGKFLISNLPTGKYKVIFQLIGYETDLF